MNTLSIFSLSELSSTALQFSWVIFNSFIFEVIVQVFCVMCLFNGSDMHHTILYGCNSAAT